MSTTSTTQVGVRKTRTHRGRRILITSVTAIVALIVNLPLLNALLVSFKPSGEITVDPLGLPSHPTLDHYANLLYAAGYDFPRFFLNSTLISLGTVALVLVIGIPATYAAVRLGFGGRIITNGATALRLAPGIFFIVPFFILFTNLGLQDSVVGMVIGNTFLNLPLAIILLAAGLQDVPVEVEEAASMDGASVIRTLVSVIIPMLAPALVSVGVLVFIFAWNEYLFALVLTTSNATPVILGAANFITSTGIRWGDISAASLVSALPPLVFAVFAQRYLVGGLSAGAIKG